jgi:hypothetical protein
MNAPFLTSREAISADELKDASRTTADKVEGRGVDQLAEKLIAVDLSEVSTSSCHYLCSETISEDLSLTNGGVEEIT